MEKQHVLPKKSQHVPNLKLEKEAEESGYKYIAGVDEAGRGPIAGPVVAAAVILGDSWNLAHPLNDSKKLSARQREQLFDVIRQEALAYRIIAVSPKKIDEINILQATLLGMQRTLTELKVCPDFVLVDGNKYPNVDMPGKSIIQGDSISCSIAAASILAKVARDRVMKGYSQIFPHWSFEQHKGYPTVKHREAVKQHGLSAIHRKSFSCLPKKDPEQLVFYKKSNDKGTTTNRTVRRRDCL